MYKKFGKRTLDITLATCALVVLALPMVLIALWVKVDSRGPALFKQLRSGKDRKAFTVYKFRTMAISAPKDAPTNSLANADMFITRSGKIMRKLSLDELPQFFNVLIGNMSLVGPRPVILREKALLSLREKVGANAVKPGVTGWAQINGRDELSPGEKAEFDGFYAARVSLRFDVKCLVMTVWTVLSQEGNKEGSEQKGSATSFDVNMAVDEG